LTPRDIDHETKRKTPILSRESFLDVGFELLGSAFTFASYPDVKGIIYLTPFACGVDAFVLEFIERRLKERTTCPSLSLPLTSTQEKLDLIQDLKHFGYDRVII